MISTPKPILAVLALLFVAIGFVWIDAAFVAFLLGGPFVLAGLGCSLAIVIRFVDTALPRGQRYLGTALAILGLWGLAFGCLSVSELVKPLNRAVRDHHDLWSLIPNLFHRVTWMDVVLLLVSPLLITFAQRLRSGMEWRRLAPWLGYWLLFYPITGVVFIWIGASGN